MKSPLPTDANSAVASVKAKVMEWAKASDLFAVESAVGSVRRQKAEGRKRKAEGRKQKAGKR
jgi:hypothetical protein